MVQPILNLLIISIPFGATWAQFKVFQNSLNPANFGDSAAGAILDEPGGDEGIPALLDAFTLCIRFQLKVFGSKKHKSRGNVAIIGDM